MRFTLNTYTNVTARMQQDAADKMGGKIASSSVVIGLESAVMSMV